MSAQDAYKRARRTDPATSRAAAGMVDLAGSQAAVVDVARRLREFTREDVERALTRVSPPGRSWSPSRVRTAIRELMDTGRIAVVDTTANSRGRRVEVLALAWPDGPGAICEVCGEHGRISVSHTTCPECELVVCTAPCQDIHLATVHGRPMGVAS